MERARCARREFRIVPSLLEMKAMESPISFPGKRPVTRSKVIVNFQYQMIRRGGDARNSVALPGAVSGKPLAIVEISWQVPETY